MGRGTVSNLIRGRVYRARQTGCKDDKLFVVVSNNSRNRQLENVLVGRSTTSPSRRAERQDYGRRG